jgi:hypothetical protein
MQQRSSGDIDIRIGLNLSVSGSPAPARKGYYNVCAKIILRGRLLRVRDGGDGVVEVVAVWGHWMGELVCSGTFPQRFHGQTSSNCQRNILLDTRGLVFMAPRGHNDTRAQ